MQNPEKIALDVVEELYRAMGQHGPITNVSDAVGRIREEYIEWEVEAFMKKFDRSKARKELVQLAAMCFRTIMF